MDSPSREVNFPNSQNHWSLHLVASTFHPVSNQENSFCFSLTVKFGSQLSCLCNCLKLLHGQLLWIFFLLASTAAMSTLVTRETPTSTKLLVISVYAPQESSEKRELWGYLCSLLIGGMEKLWSWLTEMDKLLDRGEGDDEIRIQCASLLKDLNDITSNEALDLSQKAKICQDIVAAVTEFFSTALPLYYMSIYKAPAAVLKFWNLFVGIFSMVQIRLIEKWFGFVGKSLIKTIHGVKGNIDDSQTKISGSIWQELVRDLAALKSKGDSVLKITHPRLFALELKKDITVAEKMGNASLNHFFRRLPRSGMEDESVRNHMDDVLLPKSDVPTRWVTLIPIKINILAWKISMDRLPTWFNLSCRGLEI
ncbi:hypothetical protein Tco_0343507 [Tanacetum coccineum]